MIRVKTVKRMAEAGNRTLFRVRRRAFSGKSVDSDGEEGKPDTWARWGAEYFQTVGKALAACENTVGPNAHRPPGIIDRDVTARQLWARPVVQDMGLLEEGRLAMIYEWIETNPRK